MRGLFQIVRVIRPQGAFGMLLHQGTPFAVTLERTFDIGAGGQRVVVPDGVSLCKLDYYHKGKYPTYEIQVEGHDRVLFHKLNLEEESQACIGVGESFHDFDPAQGLQKPGIADSRGGFSEFMTLSSGVPQFELYVTTKDLA